MIKKLLSLVVVAAATVTASYGQACTPNPQYADSAGGVWPDVLPTICIGQNYSTIIDVKTITDTTTNITIGGQSISADLLIQKLRINNVLNLPSQGFTYSANQPEWTNGGSAPNWTPVQGCVVIQAPASSTATLSPGSDSVTVVVDAFVQTALLGPTYLWASSLQQEILYDFPYTVAAANDPLCLVSIPEQFANSFFVSNPTPNPSNSLTTIEMLSANTEPLSINFYNMMGALVHNQTINALKGKNSYTFDASFFAPGVYTYVVTNGAVSQTRKLVVR